MNEFHTYNPRQVSVIFRGIKFSAFAEGTFIEVERSSDGWHKHVGSNGDVTRTRDLDISGTYTLTLMAQSSDNDNMQTIADFDESTGLGFGPLQVMDHNGLMECHSLFAWVRKMPKVERAKEAGSIQWVLDAADVEIQARGNITPL